MGSPQPGCPEDHQTNTQHLSEGQFGQPMVSMEGL